MTGLPAVLLFFTAMLFFRFLFRDHVKQELREIPSLRFLIQAMDDSVEKGKRIFLALGHGGLIGIPAASGFISLSLLPSVIKRSIQGDKPPAVVSGESALDILAESAAQLGIRDMEDIDLAGSAEVSLTGLTPFAYAAGTLPIVSQESTAMSVLLGSFGSEIGLIVDEAVNCGGAVVAGSENLVAQAVLTAAVPDVLVGEDLFAAGAYCQSGKMHIASLQAQDFFRVVLIVVLFLGIAAKIIGVL